MVQGNLWLRVQGSRFMVTYEELLSDLQEIERQRA